MGAVFTSLREQLQSDTLLAVAGLFAAVGVYSVAQYPISLIQVLLSFTPLSSPFRVKLSKLRTPSTADGPCWAVVTGPTSGIGNEFAFQLARKGFSVFLVGRDKAKLAQLADEVLAEAKKRGGQQAATVQTDWHPIDLARSTESDWIKFEHAITSLPGEVTVLVNCAGLSHDVPVPFEETPFEELVAIPAVNVAAVLRVTRLVVPRMVKQGRGLILNLGSFSALVPTPWLATYAGTKGFLYTWTQALGAELAEKGITVRLLNTYFVVTPMTKIRRPTFVIPTAKSYVRSALANVGLSNGAIGKAFVSTPYFPHSLIQWAVDRFMTERWWLSYNLDMQKQIAARAARKKLAASKSE